MASFLITGVSRGIGQALAQRLVGEGHQVYGVTRSAASVDDLGLAGAAELELTAFETYGPALAPLLESVPRLDGLVHCAGIVRPGSLADARPADFTDQFEVNVVAAAELIRYWLPALRAAAGTIVLVNSGSGLNARPPLSVYGTSKFALRGYAEALRQEEPGVRVCTLYPGRTATDMQRAVRAAEAGDYDEAAYLRPDTVAGVIASVLNLPPDATITDLTLRPASQPGPSSPDAHR
jgi:NAD(P)-dependent dehydrogenase (short-subunit alcohol dehydrogenase family)